MAVSKQEIRIAILDLLNQRGMGKSICPSDVTKILSPGQWRDYMELVRTIAKEMAREGNIMITRGQKVLHPDLPFNGPIWIRLNV